MDLPDESQEGENLTKGYRRRRGENDGGVHGGGNGGGRRDEIL